MARDGCVSSKDGQHFAKIDTVCGGDRYYIEGPRRHAESQARDLTGPKPTGGVNFYTYIGSTLFKWQLLKLYIYWVHRGGIMYPTLEMAKTCLKRSLFED